MTLERGDIVKLCGIGPEMVVLFEIAHSPRKWYDASLPQAEGVHCMWFDAALRQQFGVFPNNLLKKRPE